MGVSLFERWSPEYALCNAFEDMKQDGLDGLKKHLTSNALKNVESMESIANAPGVSMLTNAIMGGNAVSVFLDNLSECDWTINDIMKGSETSKAIIGFDYQDMMTGTIEMTLIKEEKIWKIDGLGMPKFDKINIPQADSDKSEE